MLFNSRLFILVFLPVVLAGFLVLSRLNRRAALGWLLLSSLFFYASWKPPLLLLLLFSIGANFYLGGAIARSGPSRLWLRGGVTFNLGLLGFFKYAGFLAALAGANAPFGGIYLPLGISFFTFQQIMYLVDIGAGDIQPAPFLDYACFISFFPHLIAGPIVRPKHILPQLAGLQPPEHAHRLEEIERARLGEEQGAHLLQRYSGILHGYIRIFCPARGGHCFRTLFRCRVRTTS